MAPVTTTTTTATTASTSTSDSLVARASRWAEENRRLVIALASATGAVVVGGLVYYGTTTRRGKGRGPSGGRGAKGEGSTTTTTTTAGRTSPAVMAGKKKKKRSAKAGSSSSNRVDESAPTTPESESGAMPAALSGSTSASSGLDLEALTVSELAAMDDKTREQVSGELKNAGNKYYGGKKYEEAIGMYTKAIAAKEEAIFYSNRAACYAALNEQTKVLEDTTNALRIDPAYLKAIVRRALAHAALGQDSSALDDYTAAMIIDNFGNEHARGNIEKLLKKISSRRASKALAERVPKLPSLTFVSAYMEAFRPRTIPCPETPTSEGDKALATAIDLLKKRRYHESMEAAERAVEAECSTDEYRAEAFNLAGTFRFIRGNAESALEALNRAIELKPSLSQTYVRRASVHMELGDPDATQRDFTEAIRVNADDPDIYYHRGQVYFILGDFEKAIKDYTKSIELDSTFIFSHIQLGVAQYKAGSIASSMATFRRCIRNFERSSDVYNYYGELLLDQQRFADAVEKFDKAIELEQKNHKAGSLPGNGSTVPTSGGEKVNKPINVLPLINKALCLFQWRQDITQAETLCQEALSIDPECDVAVATVAQLLLQKGKTEDALRMFERSAELARTEPELVNAYTYAEITRTHIKFAEDYPQYKDRLGPNGGVSAMMQ